MDGLARYLDTIGIERLWRTLKYECVYLHAWETGLHAKAGIGCWIAFYRHNRPHIAHVGHPPAVRCFNAIEPDQQRQAAASITRKTVPASERRSVGSRPNGARLSLSPKKENAARLRP